jgi:putative heme-binding domain-containing protein
VRRALVGALLLACSMSVFHMNVAMAQDEGGGGGRRAPAPTKPNPFAGNPQAMDQGMTLYNTNCASCHGLFGSGGANGPALSAGGHVDANAPDQSIFNLVKAGVPGTTMPSWNGTLSDDDIWKVALFIKGVRGNAIDSPVAGDVAHGQDIFWNKGQCGSCHVIQGKGGLAGPDLSNIAANRKVTSLMEALTKAKHKVYPGGSAHIKALTPLDNYLPVHVSLKNGKKLSGTLLNESITSLQILGDDQTLHMVDMGDVRSFDLGAKSAMPTDYDKRLTPVEFTDLMAFLTRQSTKPKPATAAR